MKVYLVMEWSKYEILAANAFSSLENAEEYILDQYKLAEKDLDDLEYFGELSLGEGASLCIKQSDVDDKRMNVTGGGVDGKYGETLGTKGSHHVKESYGWADYAADEYDRQMDYASEVERASEEAVEDGSAAEKYLDDASYNIDAPEWVFELWEDMYSSGLIDIDCQFDGEEWLDDPDPDIRICEDDEGVSGPIAKYQKPKFKQKLDAFIEKHPELEFVLNDKNFFIGKKD